MHGVIRSIVPHATCEVQVVEGVGFINLLDTNPKRELTRQQYKSEGVNQFVNQRTAMMKRFVKYLHGQRYSLHSYRLVKTHW